MVHTIAEEFAAEVARLCAIPVSDEQWQRFLAAHVSLLASKTGVPGKGRVRTLAERKRDSLERLYRYDERVAPWAGTAHGVLQAVNTYEHHESTVRGASRPERNMLRTVTGDFGKLDRDTWMTLERILV